MNTGSPAPFDAAAASYDQQFTRTRLGRWLRELVWQRLDSAFERGERVLELGCGTGEDALRLARRGVRVLASDSSPAMLAVAREKARAAGRQGQIEFTQLDMARPTTPAGWQGGFDGAFSNFGALNCLADCREIGAALARWVRPGGLVLLVLMGPYCPWEIAWHGAHGEPGRALRRLRAGAPARIAPGTSVRVWYPTPRQLLGQLGPELRHIETRGLGLLLPPPYLAHLAERWPRAFETLALLDRRIAGSWLAQRLNDHYLMVLERV